jgi:hypothetical protein
MILEANFMTAQDLMYNKEVLSQEERDIVMDFWPAMGKEYLFHNSWNNTYLNLNVYSEVEKEQRDFQMERGF